MCCASEAHGYAWPKDKGTIDESFEIIFDQPSSSECNIELPLGEGIAFKKNEKKQINNVGLEYGINDKSSIGFKIAFQDEIYKVNSVFFKGQNSSKDFKQKSAEIEMSSIMSFFKKDNQIASLYFAVSPGISYIKPASDYFFSAELARLTFGFAYGFSHNNTYVEFYGFNVMKGNQHNLTIGGSCGIRPMDKLQLTFNGAFSTGFFNDLNPANIGYIEFLNNGDEDRQRILRKNLGEFFASKKKTPMLKISTKMIIDITKNTNLSLEMGADILKAFESKYFAIGFRRII